MIYVVVTGSRDLEDSEIVFTYLTEFMLCATERFERLAVMVGDCPTGADLYARSWAEGHIDRHQAVELNVYEADWSRGKQGGPERNLAMIQDAALRNDVDGNIVAVVAFYQEGAGNRGTDNCVRLARNHGFEPIETICN